MTQDQRKEAVILPFVHPDWEDNFGDEPDLETAQWDVDEPAQEYEQVFEKALGFKIDVRHLLGAPDTQASD